MALRASDSLDHLQGRCFDYIICGGGTSGCVLAARLASLPRTSILLIEAGRDSGLAPDVEIPGKYVYQLDNDKEGLWELPTVPQQHLNGRSLTFLRGRQLGGSSAVNYMALARGPAADYDEWAALTGDDGWKWENILPLMRDVEDFDPRLPPRMKGYAQPETRYHGTGGPLKVGFGDEMVPGVKTFFDACVEVGMPVCLDNNAGNPVGVGLAQFNVRHGERSYAANAFLRDDVRRSLSNLVVVTNTECDQVLCTDRQATGVILYNRLSKETVRVECRQEVILSAGSFGSPKVLMLSGIGPKEMLQKHGIPLILEIPGCGQNMLDHSILTTEYKVDNSIPAHNQIFLDHKLLSQAEAQYKTSRSGPLAMYGSSGSVAFPRMPALFTSSEFKSLNSSEQKFLLEPTRPSAEIWLGSGPAAFAGEIRVEDSYMTHEILLQNNLSKGTVSIRSKNPRDLPLIDPNFLAHPFDQRIAIETVRMALKVAQASAYRGVIERMVHGPELDLFCVDLDEVSDETLLKFIKDNLGQGYHSLSSCKMGLKEDPMAVVDADFKVMGMRNLRVADLSVCPILTSNHTQINAYLIGERCAQRVIWDYTTDSRQAKL